MYCKNLDKLDPIKDEDKNNPFADIGSYARRKDECGCILAKSSMGAATPVQCSDINCLNNYKAYRTYAHKNEPKTCNVTICSQIMKFDNIQAAEAEFKGINLENKCGQDPAFAQLKKKSEFPYMDMSEKKNCC